MARPKKTQPETEQVKVGDIVERYGKQYEVIGFTDDGLLVLRIVEQE